jgi:hypothetical protein
LWVAAACFNLYRAAARALSAGTPRSVLASAKVTTKCVPIKCSASLFTAERERLVHDAAEQSESVRASRGER